MINRYLFYLIIAILLSSAFKATAQFSMPDNTCVGAEQHYWVDSIVGSGSTYIWKIDSIVQQNGPVNLFSIIWSTAGTYFIEVQEISVDSCPGEVQSGWVNVNVVPDSPTLAITQPTCCSASGTIIIVAPLDTCMTYGIGGVYQLNPAFSPVVPGIYSVTAKNSYGCISAETIITIDAQPLNPDVTTANTSTICSGTSTNISLTATLPSNFTWETGTVTGGITGASAGSGTAISQILTNPSITTQGTVEYIVTPSSIDCGCIGSTDTIIVTVNPIPAAVAGDNRIICLNTNTQIGAASVTGNTYNWSSVPTGFISTISNPIITPLVNTIYTLTEIITATGCQNSNSVTVLVNPLSIASIISAGGETTFCERETVVLSGNRDGIWSNGETTPSITATTGGDYFVTNANFCGSETSNHILVTVRPLPAATTGNDFSFCVGNSVTLGSISNPGHTYSWTPVIELSSATISNPEASPIVTTTYTLTETNNETGCQNSNPVTVTVDQNPISSTISATGSTTICEGENLILTGNNGGIWSNGESTSSITVYKSGEYFVVNKNSCGSINSNHILVTVNPIPAAITGSDADFCIGNSVDIGATSKSGCTYSWVPVTRLSSSTISNPEASPHKTTTYTLTETITETGCKNSNSVIVTVDQNPKASTISSMGNTTICEGENMVISGNKGGIWSNGATTPSITVNTGGDYFVTNETACQIATSNHILVTVNPLPSASTISASGATSICEGEKVILSGNNGGTWSNGETTQSIKVNTSGDYFAVNTNNCNSITSNHILVTVNPLPTATSGDDASICSGNTKMIGASSTSGHTYSWAPATGLSSSTIANPFASPLETTTYTLTETITATGCQSLNSVNLSVDTAPNVTTEPIDQTTCEGDLVNFSVEATGSGLRYQWRNGTVELTDGRNISGTASSILTIYPVNVFDVASNYNVVVTGTCSPSETSPYVSLVINTAPNITLEPINQLVDFGDSVNFSVEVTGSYLTYQWRKGDIDLTDGGNISGATSSTLTIDPVTEADTSSIYNVVINGLCLPISTSNYATLWACCCTDNTSVSYDASNKTIIIYPNPFKAFLNIIIKDESQIDKCELSIFNVMGEEVINKTIINQNTTLETSILCSGIYFYKIIGNENIIQSGKLISIK